MTDAQPDEATPPGAADAPSTDDGGAGERFAHRRDAREQRENETRARDGATDGSDADGREAGLSDVGAPDAGAPDAGAPDAGAPDAGAPDAVADTPVQYGVGPFSLREVVLGAVWVVAFALSFLSTVDFTFSSLWTQGIAWILPIGVPTVAVFLVALRRLSPTGIRRVGSLGIDQFASVAFSVATVVWLGQVWSQVQISVAGGRWSLSWMPWAQLVLMAGGVVLTVFAPVIPGLCEDFRHRPPATAHRSARPIRPVVARPRRVVAPQPQPEAAPVAVDPTRTVVVPAVGGGDTGATVIPPDAFAPHDDSETTGAPEDEPVPAVVEAFWALVPEQRDVVDDNGTVLFRIGPSAWALAIEDRGDVLVIRHEDGRVGLLRDVSGVTRG